MKSHKWMLKGALILVVLAMAVSACGSTTSTGGSSSQPKVTIMVGGLDKIIYLPMRLADRLGYFKEAGVNVTLIDEPSGVGADEALIARQVDVAVFSYDHTIDAAGLGKKDLNIFQLDNAPGEAIVVSSKATDITSAADFTGKNIGVTSIGSGTYFLTSAIALKKGVKQNQIHFVAAQAGNVFIAAMQQDRIDAGMTTDPTIARIVSSGLGKVLVDLRTTASTQDALGGNYPFISMNTRPDWLSANKDTAQKLVNALAKTMKYLHTHTAAEIADQMPPDYYAGNKALYISALNANLGIYSTDGKLAAADAASVLSIQQQFNKNVIGKQIDLTQTYDMEFVNAVPAS